MTPRTPVIPPPASAARATIAALARTAPPVAAALPPWAQQTDETDPDYAAFEAWLLSGAGRGAVPAVHRASSARHDWAERALAWDREQQLGPPPGAITAGGNTTPEAQIVNNLTRLVQIETSKLLQQAQSSPAPVVALKDLTATVRVLQELHEAGRTASRAAAAQDLSRLSKEELQAWLTINRKLTGDQRK